MPGRPCHGCERVRTYVCIIYPCAIQYGFVFRGSLSPPPPSPPCLWLREERVCLLLAGARRPLSSRWRSCGRLPVADRVLSACPPSPVRRTVQGGSDRLPFLEQKAVPLTHFSLLDSHTVSEPMAPLGQTPRKHARRSLTSLGAERRRPRGRGPPTRPFGARCSGASSPLRGADLRARVMLPAPSENGVGAREKSGHKGQAWRRTLKTYAES